MDLTRYNPNNDRGITTKPNVSSLRCFDGEDLRKLTLSQNHLQYIRSARSCSSSNREIGWTSSYRVNRSTRSSRSSTNSKHTHVKRFDRTYDE